MAGVAASVVSELAPASPWAAGRHPARLPARWLLLALVASAVAVMVAVVVGPIGLPVRGVIGELLDRLPFVEVSSGLAPIQAAIVTEVRLPRALVAFVVGALLATSGGAYQGVFRNPLADPYLLGVASGAGLGATVAIVGAGSALGATPAAVPAAAFVGALAAVGLTYLLGASADRLRSNASLILAGVAVAALCSAAQTFLLQQDDESVRDVYSWLLGRLNVAGWDDLQLLAPYAAISLGVMVVAAGRLDVLAVGDEEAGALGVRPTRLRLLVVLAATLGTAAAVAVSGLIGFVGIIVPHAVRLRCGGSARRVVPLSLLFGGAFLCLADLVARSLLSPAEVPIGVITAAVGAPFFLVLLRSSGMERT